MGDSKAFPRKASAQTLEHHSDCPPCACGSPAKCICSCRFPMQPLTQLCEPCVIRHQQLLGNHHYLDTEAFQFIKSSEDLTEVFKRNAFRCEMRESLQKIEVCKSEVGRAVGVLVATLNHYQEEIIQQLDQCQARVLKGIELIDAMQYSRAEEFQFPYQNLNFSYYIDQENVAKAITNWCNFRIDSGNSGNSEKVHTEVKTEGLGSQQFNMCSLFHFGQESEQCDTRVSYAHSDSSTPMKRKAGSCVHHPKKKQVVRQCGGDVPSGEKEEAIEGEKPGEVDVLVVNYSP